MNAQSRAMADMATKVAYANAQRIREREQLMAKLIELSDERDQWMAFALDIARDAYANGYADGQVDPL